MVAIKDTSSKEVDMGDPRNWYLTIRINGTELEFIASEGKMIHFTPEEALHRVKEFETMVAAENKHYTHGLVDKALAKLFC